MIKVYWTRAIAPGSGERHFISPLRFQEPIFLNKDIDYKEFLGPELLHCPGIVEEMTKTVVIKSPVTVDLEYADDQNLKIHRQDPAFGQIFFGQPQGKNGIHQLGFGYIFFADKPLMATNLPAYYHDNGYTRNVDAICGSYDIGRWFRPGVRLLFQKKPGTKNININEGDALMYVKFNTDEKIELVEFDAHELDQLGFHSPINACITLKNQLPPTPLNKAYEYFDNARMRQKVLKIIKRNVI
jgi:hypothetical protein